MRLVAVFSNSLTSCLCETVLASHTSHLCWDAGNGFHEWMFVSSFAVPSFFLSLTHTDIHTFSRSYNI